MHHNSKSCPLVVNFRLGVVFLVFKNIPYPLGIWKYGIPLVGTYKFGHFKVLRYFYAGLCISVLQMFRERSKNISWSVREDPQRGVYGISRAWRITTI